MMSNYSDEIVEDDFGNLRYIGANPNNYVQFNEELWRIIGVMKDIENPDGTKEDKIKLIRSDRIGIYSWDNKASGVGSSTSEYGSNDWSDSTLQKVLNEEAYYNRTSGDCPYGKNGATRPCDFSEAGLTSDAKSMISESVWNLGGLSDYTSKTPKEIYEAERGEVVYTGRPTKWTGKVGLIYVSDGWYATGGGSTIDRSSCLNKNIHTWYNSDVSDCRKNDWLYRTTRWTLTPYSAYNSTIFNLRLQQYETYDSTRAYDVHPTIYLNSQIKISNNQNGSDTTPFILNMN